MFIKSFPKNKFFHFVNDLKFKKSGINHKYLKSSPYTIKAHTILQTQIKTSYLQNDLKPT